MITKAISLNDNTVFTILKGEKKSFVLKSIDKNFLKTDIFIMRKEKVCGVINLGEPVETEEKNLAIPITVKAEFKPTLLSDINKATLIVQDDKEISFYTDVDIEKSVSITKSVKDLKKRDLEGLSEEERNVIDKKLDLIKKYTGEEPNLEDSNLVSLSEVDKKSYMLLAKFYSLDNSEKDFSAESLLVRYPKTDTELLIEKEDGSYETYVFYKNQDIIDNPTAIMQCVKADDSGKVYKSVADRQTVDVSTDNTFTRIAVLEKGVCDVKRINDRSFICNLEGDRVVKKFTFTQYGDEKNHTVQAF